MITLRKISASVLAAFSLTASAAVFDFESTPISSGLTSLSLTNAGLTATITRVGGTSFDVSNPSVAAFGSRALSPFNDTSASAFIVNFSALVSGVSVQMGDFAPSDTDTLTIQAYSGANGTGTLLGSVSLSLPNSPNGFNFLTVSVGSASISSIVMNGGSNDFPNSVYYDNITATTGSEVPDSTSTGGLLVLALAVVTVARRRLK